MDEFIKREDALNAIKAVRSVCGCSAIDRDDAENAIMDCPTSDVAPKGEVHDDHHKQVTCYALGCREGDKIKQEVARKILTDLAYNKELLPLPSWAIEKLIKEYTEGRMNMTNKELLEDLLIEFDELGMMPTLIVPNPEERAKDWKHELTYAIKHLKADVAIEVLSDIKKRLHDKATYPHGSGIDPYISLKVVDAIIQDKLKHLEERRE